MLPRTCSGRYCSFSAHLSAFQAPAQAAHQSAHREISRFRVVVATYLLQSFAAPCLSCFQHCMTDPAFSSALSPTLITCIQPPILQVTIIALAADSSAGSGAAASFPVLLQATSNLHPMLPQCIYRDTQAFKICSVAFVKSLRCLKVVHEDHYECTLSKKIGLSGPKRLASKFSPSGHYTIERMTSVVNF